jgi:hypothetical protein
VITIGRLEFFVDCAVCKTRVPILGQARFTSLRRDVVVTCAAEGCIRAAKAGRS